MKGSVLAFDRNARRSIAALVEDGTLTALEIDLQGESTPLPGAVYRAGVGELLPALGAAILELGSETAFLPDARGRVSGESLLVQVRREADPREGKAARVSTDLQLSAPGLVFTPSKPGLNISRKIDDPETRQRLSETLASFADHGGFVLRTRAAQLGSAALREAAERLVEAYQQALAATACGLAMPAPDAVTRILSVHAPPDRLLTNDADNASGLDAVEIVEDPLDALDLHGRIAALASPTVRLREGDARIETTAALLAVDVNSGGARGGDVALRVNLSAAAALPREIALRKLGGVVMIDFAAGPKGRERDRIETALRRSIGALEGTRMLGWGPAGLFELRCPRPGRSLRDLLAKGGDA